MKNIGRILLFAALVCLALGFCLGSAALADWCEVYGSDGHQFKRADYDSVQFYIAHVASTILCTSKLS